MMRTQRDRRRGAARGGALQLLFVRVRIMGVAVFIVREIVTTKLKSASLRVFAPLAVDGRPLPLPRGRQQLAF
eukprot:COSAG02_NODE_13_length_57813_cov_14.298276_46_plen_73_part_00